MGLGLLTLAATAGAETPPRGVGVAQTASLATVAMPQEGPPWLDSNDLCQRVAKKLSSVKSTDCSPERFDSVGRSFNGLPLLAREYGPRPGRQPMGRVLMIGGIHGDEYSSISVVYRWMRTLDEHHSGLFHWQVLPLLNPDGLLRKKSQRMNERGVDLNRNFPTPNWVEETEDYWVHKTKRNPRRYPGPHPLSEPESQALMRIIDEFRPDAIVSVHAPFGILDFDGPRHPPQRLGHLHLNLLGTYPGSLGNYAGVQNSIPVITIELPFAGIMPSYTQSSAIWMDLVQWLQRNMEESKPVQAREEERQTESS